MLTITQAGLAAITSAAEGGFKIKMKSFRLTQHDVSGFSNTDFVNATDLVGATVYSGNISLIEVVGTSTVRLTLTIPKELPRTGSWMLREIGVYLETGELFAIGALEPAYEKNNAYGIRIYVLCSQDRLGEVASVTVGQGNSLPMVPQIAQLPSPLGSEHNVVAVLDESTAPYGGGYSSGLATRSGPGLLHWAFSGHSRIYHGLADQIITQFQLRVSSASGGFWLNNNEVVIVQCTTGSGAGKTRRMKYDAEADHFTVIDQEFGELDSTSMLAIWRDNANQLPERKETIPDYMVLGHGLNSWKKVDNTVRTFTTFTAQVASGTLNSDSQLGSTNIEPVGADKIIMVWCDGKLIPENQYATSWNVITVYGKPYGTKIDIVIFKQVPSSVGGVPNVFESKLYGDGQTKRFHMSIVPKSSEWIAVYVDGVFKHRTEYDFFSTNIVLHEAPADQAEVQIIQIGVYDDTHGSAIWSRTFRQLTPGVTDIAYAQPIRDKSQVMLFIDGELYTHADYQLTATGLQVLKTPSFPGGSSFADLFLFVPTTSITEDQSITVTGTNTGPRWIDPAGLEGAPNKLIPKVVSMVSDGAQVQIAIPEVINSDYVIVFADGAIKQSNTYSIVPGFVVLNQPVTAGDMVDVIAFTESTIDEGFDVECTTFNFISSTDTVYQLAPVTNEDNVIVTVAGKYQHRLSYTIDPQSRIFFQNINSGEKVEVWYFNNVVSVGHRTTMRRDLAGGVAANNYPLSQIVSRKQNVLTFVGNNKYDNDQYSLGSGNNAIALNPPATINMSVVCISFVSAAPKTRLLTRAEYNQSVVSFNYRTGTILLTREDVAAVLHREDVFALFTTAEKAILSGGGGVVNPPETPHAEPGNTFVSSYWVVPTGVYHIKAVIIGGGGGGGGGSNDLSYAGHGGQRGKVQIVEMDVTPGQQLEVRLGAGGSPYLYTIDGTTIYPQPGDYGTSDGSRGYPGRNGESTIFSSWVVAGGQGGGSEPAYGPDYIHADSAGEGQVPVTGTGALQGGGAPGQVGVMTDGNNTMSYSYPGQNGALGWSTSNSTGGGHNATSPGAGGGGASADPNGVGAFGGAGANGVVYISWS